MAMATPVSWLVGTALMLVLFGVVACSALGSRRRSPFYLRLGCVSLVMLGLALGLAFAIESDALAQRMLGPAWLGLLLVALIMPPVFCYETFSRSQSSSNGEGGDGPGSGPPPPQPTPPRGGTPLPDADQARLRMRDHNRPSLRGAGPRRRAVEPVRPGAPAVPGSR